MHKLVGNGHKPPATQPSAISWRATAAQDHHFSRECDQPEISRSSLRDFSDKFPTIRWIVLISSALGSIVAVAAIVACCDGWIRLGLLADIIGLWSIAAWLSKMTGKANPR